MVCGGVGEREADMPLPTRSQQRTAPGPDISLSRPGTVRIFTFKQGLLSTLAHDLRVSVTRFDIELSGGKVRARFDVRSAQIDGVVLGERVDPSRFSKQDTEVIARNMRDAILNVTKFPTVELEGDVQPVAIDRWVLHGRLAMVGRTCDIEIPVIHSGSQLAAELELKPSRWGIQPFTTMGGAIGIQDRWRVRAELALGGHQPAELLGRVGVVRWAG